MPRVKKTTAIVPFVFYGSIIEKDYILNKFKKKIKTTKEVNSFIEELLSSNDSGLYLVDANKLVMRHHPNAIFLGYGISEMPESYSRKRCCIEVWDELVRCQIIDDSVDAQTVGLLIDLCEIEST